MKAKHVTVFIVIAFLVLGMSPDCIGRGPLEEFSDGYFRYVVVGEYRRNLDKDTPPVIAIIGFTELGLQQEVIDIPREIDGKPVLFVGYVDDLRREHLMVEAEGIKKLYIHDNIKRFVYFIGRETDIMCCSVNDRCDSYNDEYKIAYFLG